MARPWLKSLALIKHPHRPFALKKPIRVTSSLVIVPLVSLSILSKSSWHDEGRLRRYLILTHPQTHLSHVGRSRSGGWKLELKNLPSPQFLTFPPPTAFACLPDSETRMLSDPGAGSSESGSSSSSSSSSRLHSWGPDQRSRHTPSFVISHAASRLGKCWKGLQATSFCGAPSIRYGIVCLRFPDRHRRELKAGRVVHKTLSFRVLVYNKYVAGSGGWRASAGPVLPPGSSADRPFGLQAPEAI